MRYVAEMRKCYKV